MPPSVMRARLAACFLALAAGSACDKPQPVTPVPAPAPPAGAGKSDAKSSQTWKIGGTLAQLLAEADGVAKPTPGDAIAEYEGSATQVPLTLKPEPPKIDPGFEPDDLKWQARAPHRNDGGDWCVYEIFTGPKGNHTGDWTIAKDIPELRDNEMVYQIEKGYGLFGGNWPVARGRRSRAGAPGTQFALEVSPDQNGSDFYYLLSSGENDAVRICSGASGWNCDTLKDKNKYIEVTSDGTILPAKDIPPDLADPRRKFYENAKAIALRGELMGEDPKFAEALRKRIKQIQDRWQKPD